MKTTWSLSVQKSTLLCVVLTILLFTSNFNVISGAQESSYESLAILLNNVKSSKYRFSDHEGNVGEISFRTLGEETVSGESTWKVEAEYSGEGEEPERVTIWISKSTGQCLQAELEGEVYTGDFAAMIGSSVLIFWTAWVGTWQEVWNFTEMYHWEEIGYGRLVFLGTETKTLGPSQILVYKWRWEGYVNAPEDYRGVAECWFAPVSFGTLLAKIYFESLDRTEWQQIELLSVELVKPQPRPNILVETKLDKEQLIPGEDITISAEVSNNGDAMGAYNHTIIVNGEMKWSELVVLNPGEHKSLSHNLSFSEQGTYVIKVGDKTFTAVVSAVLPARFEVSNLSISPSSVEVGKGSLISINVKNTGGESGSYEIVLKVNGEVIERKSVTLDPDQLVDVSFSFSPSSEGTYSIDVNGLTGNLAASKPPEEEGPGAAVSGIPWSVLIAVPIIVVVVLVVLFLRRKPKPKEEYPPPPPPPI